MVPKFGKKRSGRTACQLEIHTMDKNQFKRDAGHLLMLAAALAVACLVILFFFRTSVFIGVGKKLVSILMPFIYGAVIAYLLRPACFRLEGLLLRLFHVPADGKRRSSFRLVSVLISLILMLALIVLLLVIVLPQLISSISSLIQQLPAALEKLRSLLKSFDTGESSHEIVVYLQQAADTLSGRLQAYLQTSLLPDLQSLISRITSSFMGLVDFLGNFGLGCIVAVYFLASWEKIKAQAKMVVYGIFPQKAADWIRHEVRFSDSMFSSFINGKILDSAIIGLICFIFCSLMNMPYALLVSVIVGITNIIPFFGPYIGAIPSALLILTVSPGKCILFVIFIIVLQQIDGNILGPAILGGKMGLSSFWILFSILFFGSIWGLPGMLVGVPFFAVLYDLITRFIVSRLRKKGQEEMVGDYTDRFCRQEPEKKPSAPGRRLKTLIKRKKS